MPGPLVHVRFYEEPCLGQAIRPASSGASPGIPVLGMAVAEKGIVGLDVCYCSTALTGKQPVPSDVWSWGILNVTVSKGEEMTIQWPGRKRRTGSVSV